jgi:HEAT repeat protein
MELESAIVSTMENADDPIIQGVREQIKSMFGHHLAQGKPMINSSTGDVIDGFQSPGSPSSPPHSISESLMPLLDLPDSVSVSTSALQQRKLSPHHLLSSPPPPAAAAQHHDTNVDDENRDNSTTVYISPSSAPNTLEHPTSRVLEFASSTQGNQRLLHENLKGMRIDPNGQVTLHSNHDGNDIDNTARARAVPAPSFSLSGSYGSFSQHNSHQSTAAPSSSDSLMSDLFSNKLIPSHTRSPPAFAEKVEDPPVNVSTGNTTRMELSSLSSSSSSTTTASTTISADVLTKMSHCSAFLGHRNEVERYASLLTMKEVISKHMRTLPPNSSMPLDFLQETTLRDFIVMLEQAPIGIDSNRGGRCHALCLDLLKLYGSHAAPIVPRLASLLQRLWTIPSVGGLNYKNTPYHSWSYVQPRWIIDTMVCIGLKGIDALIDMCQDGYGDVDSTILGKLNKTYLLFFVFVFSLTYFYFYIKKYIDGIVQHPSIQQNIVAVALSDDLSHPSMKRATDAVIALSRLGSASSSSINDMLTLLKCTAVKPNLVCNALARASSKYDRTGELELAKLVETATRPEVRQAASSSLGQLFKKKGGNILQGLENVKVSVAQKICSISETISNVGYLQQQQQHQPMQPWSVQPVTLVDGKSLLVDGRYLLTSLQAVRSERQRNNVGWWNSWNGSPEGYQYAISGAMNCEMGMEIEMEQEENYNISLESFRALDAGLNDDHFDVRASCVLSLAMACCDDPSILTTTGTLRRMIVLLEDENDVVRASAAEAVGRMGATVLPLTSAESFEGMKMLQNYSSSTNRTPCRRQKHSQSVGRSNRTGFTPGSTRFIRSQHTIYGSAHKGNDSANRSRSNNSRRSVNQNSASEHPLLATMQRLLKDRRHRVRHSTCIAIGHLGSGANDIAMDVLHALDSGKVKRGAAARTLVKLVPVGQQILLDLLCNARCQTKGGEKTRVAACQGLASLPVDSILMDAAVRVLFDTCQDPTADVRAEAIQTLGSLSTRTNEAVTYLKSRSLLPFVYSHLRDSDQVVRLAAAKVLANSSPQGEMLLIEGLLQDKDERVRVAITHGLKHVGPSSIRTLLLAMRDHSKSVRKASSEVIIFFGIDGIAKVLLERPETARTAVVHELKNLLKKKEFIYPDGTNQVLLGVIGRLSGFTVLRRDL